MTVEQLEWLKAEYKAGFRKPKCVPVHWWKLAVKAAKEEIAREKV